MHPPTIKGTASDAPDHHLMKSPHAKYIPNMFKCLKPNFFHFYFCNLTQLSTVTFLYSFILHWGMQYCIFPPYTFFLQNISMSKRFHNLGRMAVKVTNMHGHADRNACSHKHAQKQILPKQTRVFKKYWELLCIKGPLLLWIITGNIFVFIDFWIQTLAMRMVHKVITVWSVVLALLSANNIWSFYHLISRIFWASSIGSRDINSSWLTISGDVIQGYVATGSSGINQIVTDRFSLN